MGDHAEARAAGQHDRRAAGLQDGGDVAGAEPGLPVRRGGHRGSGPGAAARGRRRGEHADHGVLGLRRALRADQDPQARALGEEGRIAERDVAAEHGARGGHRSRAADAPLEQVERAVGALEDIGRVQVAGRVARERRLVDVRGVPVVQRVPDARPARVGGRRERERGDAGQGGDDPALRFPVHRRDAIGTDLGRQGPHGDRRVLVRRPGAPPRPLRRSRVAARAAGTGTPRSPRAASAPPTSRARRRAGPRSARGRAWARAARPPRRSTRRGEEDVVADGGEGAPGVGRRVAPGVLAVQRGAVVDEPQPSVPGEQVGVLRRAVHVGGQRVEPDDRGGHVGRRLGADGGR